jgi:hypothetical protein
MRFGGSKIIKRFLAGAAILGVALTAAVVPVASTAASAGTTPVMYAAHLDGWHGYVKPSYVLFGNGGAPYLTNLTWTSWKGTSAWGTGKMWTQKPGCTPSYKCAYYARWVGVSMTNIWWHGSQRYYARMAVEFYNAGAWRWDVGWLKYPFAGATVPFWVFPATFPYL